MCHIPSDLQGNAGCLIVHEGRFLAARHLKKDKWNLPGGTYERGESAQCTAQRETREELGVTVIVGELLREHSNGFYLFRCTFAAGQFKAAYVVPRSGTNDVSRIQWLLPDEIQAHDWRYPQRWPSIAALVQGQR